MNKALGPDLFNSMSNGIAINKSNYDNGALVPNPLFDELASNRDAYTEIYSSIGFDLKARKNFFYMSDKSVDLFPDVAMKIAALLDILARKMAAIPLFSEALLDSSAGLPKAKVVEFDRDDEVKLILAACGMKGGLLTSVENIMVGRKIAYWNRLDALVLTDAGIQLFDDLFADEDGVGS